jgi:hypothetical protein
VIEYQDLIDLFALDLPTLETAFVYGCPFVTLDRRKARRIARRTGERFRTARWRQFTAYIWPSSAVVPYLDLLVRFGRDLGPRGLFA